MPHARRMGLEMFDATGALNLSIWLNLLGGDFCFPVARPHPTHSLMPCFAIKRNLQDWGTPSSFLQFVVSHAYSAGGSVR